MYINNFNQNEVIESTGLTKSYTPEPQLQLYYYYFYCIIFFGLWMYEFLILENIIQKKKVSKTLVSFTHCILSIVLSYQFLVGNIQKDLEYCISTAYFIYDGILLLRYEKGLMRNGYLLHHILSIFFLYEFFNPIYDVWYIILLYMILEISNIFLHIVYILYQYKISYKVIQYFEKIQFWIYFPCRIIFIPICMIMICRNGWEWSGIIGTSLIYLMGVYWSWRLYLKITKSLKKD